MIAQRMAMVPTLHLFDGRWQWEIGDEVRTFARQGGEILFGTDVGYLPDFDHAIEYERMASAGLGWREILTCLTTAPARAIRRRRSARAGGGRTSTPTWSCSAAIRHRHRGLSPTCGRRFGPDV